MPTKRINPPKTRARLVPGSLGNDVDPSVAKAIRDQSDAIARLEDQTGSNVSLFTATTDGIVPASGGGIVKYLRADGTWIDPTSAGGVPSTRLINTILPLTGGGDLSVDRTFSVNLFSSGASGVVPASGGGVLNFLRADGSWTSPVSGYSSGTGFTNTVPKWTSAAVLGASSLTDDGTQILTSEKVGIGNVTTAGALLDVRINQDATTAQNVILFGNNFTGQGFAATVSVDSAKTVHLGTTSANTAWRFDTSTGTQYARIDGKSGNTTLTVNGTASFLNATSGVPLLAGSPASFWFVHPASNFGAAIARAANDAGAGHLIYWKTRSTDVSVQSTVLNGDSIGDIQFQASDGTSAVTGATILGIVNGTVATGSIPTDLVFKTGAAAGGNEQMRIAGLSGLVTMQRGLTVTGNVTVNGIEAIQSPNLVNGGGVQDMLILGGGSTISTFGDAIGVHFQQDTGANYHARILSKNTATSPSFLNPELAFQVQATNTIGVGNLVTQLEVAGSGVTVNTNLTSTSGTNTIGNLTETVSAVTLSADQTAWSLPLTSTVIDVTSTASGNRIIHGIDSTGTADGRVLVIKCSTGVANAIFYKHQDATALAANRLSLMDGVQQEVNCIQGSITFIYRSGVGWVQTAIQSDYFSSIYDNGTLDVLGFATLHSNALIGILEVSQSSTLDGTLLVRGKNTFAPAAQIAAVEFSFGRNNSGANAGSASSATDIAFQFAGTGGGFRHWITTTHNAAADPGNSINFYLNTSATAGGSSAPGTGNTEVLSLYGNQNAQFWGALAVAGASIYAPNALTTIQQLQLTQAGDTYILDSLATSTGTQGLNISAAGTGQIRFQSGVGGVTNAGTGGIVLSGGGSDTSDKWKVDNGGNQTNTGNLTVLGQILQTAPANVDNVKITRSQAGQTTGNSGIYIPDTGTFNTTAGALVSGGITVSTTSTRSAGTNLLTNRAAYFSASGAQINYALFADAGDVFLNNTSGNTTINGTTFAQAIQFHQQSTGVYSPTAATADGVTQALTAGGTYDATAALRNSYAGQFTANATRSAGANPLTNYAVYANASGAQTNYAFYGAAGQLLQTGTSALNGAVTFGGGFSSTGASACSVNAAFTVGNGLTVSSGGATISGTLTSNTGATLSGDNTVQRLNATQITVSLTASQNNWSPTGLATATTIVINGNGSVWTVTGLDSTGTNVGRRITVINESGNSLIFTHQDASSTVSNRFTLRGAANVQLGNDGALEFEYVSGVGWFQVNECSFFTNGSFNIGSEQISGTLAVSGLVDLTGQSVYLGRQVLSASSGTYTPTTGTRKVLVRIVGGGGGGGGGQSGTSTSAAGAGGSGGAYVEKWINPGATITGGAYTTGAFGAAGASTGGTGGAGGDSTIVIQAVTYTAKGGPGGSGMLAGSASAFATPGGYSAASTTGDINSQDIGDAGVRVSTALYWGGKGGGSPIGAGGMGGFGGGGVAGSNGTGFGSGGGGANVSTPGAAGGKGTNGIIIVDEWR